MMNKNTTIPCFTKLYHTVLYYTILYYTILYYTILYYTPLTWKAYYVLKNRRGVSLLKLPP